MRFNFTSKEYEHDVRLYYFAAWYYDRHIARFTQRDPAEDGANWYIYTYSNPLKFVDPTGELAILSDSYFNGPNAYRNKKTGQIVEPKTKFQ